MAISRIYQAAALQPGGLLRLDEKASHHLARVLRAGVGDKLTLFNGQGGEYEASITHIDKKGVDVELISFVSRDVEAPISIHLAQGMARGEKMDMIVQKAVELGVKKITPLMTERCNLKLDHEREEKRLQHWRSIAISACEQCGRNYLPELMAPISLMEWLKNVKEEQRFILSPHVQNKLPAEDPISSIVLLIGPEGGFSEREMDVAKQYCFLPLNLGPRVLRTETATIAALATLQYRYGDFS